MVFPFSAAPRWVTASFKSKRDSASVPGATNPPSARSSGLFTARSTASASVATSASKPTMDKQQPFPAKSSAGQQHALDETGRGAADGNEPVSQREEEVVRSVVGDFEITTRKSPGKNEATHEVKRLVDDSSGREKRERSEERKVEETTEIASQVAKTLFTTSDSSTPSVPVAPSKQGRGLAGIETASAAEALLSARRAAPVVLGTATAAGTAGPILFHQQHAQNLSASVPGHFVLPHQQLGSLATTSLTPRVVAVPALQTMPQLQVTAGLTHKDLTARARLEPAVIRPVAAPGGRTTATRGGSSSSTANSFSESCTGRSTSGKNHRNDPAGLFDDRNSLHNEETSRISGTSREGRDNSTNTGSTTAVLQQQAAVQHAPPVAAARTATTVVSAASVITTRQNNRAAPPIGIAIPRLNLNAAKLNASTTLSLFSSRPPTTVPSSREESRFDNVLSQEPGGQERTTESLLSARTTSSMQEHRDKMLNMAGAQGCRPMKIVTSNGATSKSQTRPHPTKILGNAPPSNVYNSTTGSKNYITTHQHPGTSQTGSRVVSFRQHATKTVKSGFSSQQQPVLAYYEDPQDEGNGTATDTDDDALLSSSAGKMLKRSSLLEQEKIKAKNLLASSSEVLQKLETMDLESIASPAKRVDTATVVRKTHPSKMVDEEDEIIGWNNKNSEDAARPESRSASHNKCSSQVTSAVTVAHSRSSDSSCSYTEAEVEDEDVGQLHDQNPEQLDEDEEEIQEIREELKKAKIPLLQPEWNSKPTDIFEKDKRKTFSTQNTRVVVVKAKKSNYELECQRLDRLIQDGLIQQKLHLKKAQKTVDQVSASEKRLVGQALKQLSQIKRRAEEAKLHCRTRVGEKGEKKRNLEKLIDVLEEEEQESAFLPDYVKLLRGKMQAFKEKVLEVERELPKRRTESRIGHRERIDRMDCEIAESSSIVEDLQKLTTYGDLLTTAFEEVRVEKVDHLTTKLEKYVQKMYQLVVMVEGDDNDPSEVLWSARRNYNKTGTTIVATTPRTTGTAAAAAVRDHQSPGFYSLVDDEFIRNNSTSRGGTSASTAPAARSSSASSPSPFKTTCPTGINQVLVAALNLQGSSPENKNKFSSPSSKTNSSQQPRETRAGVPDFSPSLKRAASYATSNLDSDEVEKRLSAKDEKVTIMREYMQNRTAKLTTTVASTTNKAAASAANIAADPKPKWKIGSYRQAAIVAPLGKAVENPEAWRYGHGFPLHYN
ncbi:unnamed protein product [Amoebophrya sp. A120]|nr:unnamed protein product [Amoebophrya sp. A120]|eukprot:GSA120T00008381001.1